MSQKLHVSHVVLALFFPEPRYPDDHLESLLLPFVVGTTQIVLWTTQIVLWSPLWIKFTRTDKRTNDLTRGCLSAD